jgi:hypothetical protein
MWERSFVRVPRWEELRGVEELRQNRAERTSWSFDCDDSRADLDLDVLWDFQRLV